MDDIVERLRKSAGREYYDGHGALELEAADEIERLRSQGLAPSFCWDGFMVTGLGRSLDEVFSLVMAAKRLPELRKEVERFRQRVRVDIEPLDNADSVPGSHIVKVRRVP